MDSKQNNEIPENKERMRKLIPYVVLLVGLFLFTWALLSLNSRRNSEVVNSPSISGNPENSSSGSTSSQGSSDSYTRVDQGEGNVEVSTTYITPNYLEAQGLVNVVGDLKLEEEFAFAVYLNTHSVNLTGYQVDKLSYLRDEQGQEYSALPGWISLNESDHHRSGIIRFARFDNSGNAVVKPEAKFFELVIKDIAGIGERRFRWELPLGS